MKGVKEIGGGWGGCGVKGMRVGIEALFYTSGTNIQVEKRVMVQEKRGGPKEHGGVALGEGTFPLQRNESRTMSTDTGSPADLVEGNEVVLTNCFLFFSDI